MYKTMPFTPRPSIMGKRLPLDARFFKKSPPIRMETLFKK